MTYENDKFTVKTDQGTQQFDYVAVATGHFSVPNNPTFENEESFPGEIIHSHSFVESTVYKNKRVLCIGGSYSAEDIAFNCWKYKERVQFSKHIDLSHL